MNGRLSRERVSLAEVVGDHIIHMDSSSRVEDQEYMSSIRIPASPHR